MRLQTTGICRGNGVAYLGFALHGLDDVSNVCFKSFSEDGTPLPVEAYQIDSDDSGSLRYIAVVPLLDTKKVGIEILVYDERGVVVHRGRKTFSRFFIKWASRFNYQFHHDEAMKMRDVDRSVYFGQVHVNPGAFIVSSQKHEFIAKGYACVPSGDAPVFRVIDGMGHEVENPRLYIGQTQVSRALDVPRYETTFSLRFPDDGNTYCLIVEGKDDSKAGFLCFDPEARKGFIFSSPLFYKSSGREEYRERAAARKRLLAFANPSDYQNLTGPLFSIVVPLYKTPIPLFKDMVASVQSQLYRNWELILVNASPDDAELSTAVNSLNDDRIHVIALDENRGIAANTNAGIEAATGDYIVFFDHDDTLDPFALYKYAKAIDEDSSIDALYCDEDFLNEDGEYTDPHFKSDLNIDLLRCHNYITHLLAVRASYGKDLMLRSEFDGAQDYDFLLRLVERTQNICHIPDVLYHWRICDTSTTKSANNKSYADDAGRRALQEHLNRCGLDATAELSDIPFVYHVRYSVLGNPLVSIIIPNKDNIDVLSRCIDSVEKKSAYRNFEIVIVENNSVDMSTFDYYRNVQNRYKNVKVITWTGPFNYSAINNYAVPSTSGDYLLFLNNDVEVIEPHWLEAMIGLCQREDVGIVGAKLLYPDDTIQHAGVMMVKCQNLSDAAGPVHVFGNLDRDDPGYKFRAQLVQDLSAVTAACMMTKRSIFVELNGFDETFEVAYNDVDYCLRLRETGKLVVYTPDALLYHYESVSRGADTLPQNAERFMREQGKLRTRWSSYYANGDPYHGPASMVSYYSEMP